MAEAATLIGECEPVILGIDNGGTNTRIFGDNIEHTRHYETPSDYEEAIGKLVLASDLVLKGRKPDAIGYCIAGAVENGKLTTAGALSSWVGKKITEDVADAFGVSPDRVVLMNDCTAGAIAEQEARKLPPDALGGFKVVSTGHGGALYRGTEIIPDEPGHHVLKNYLGKSAVCGCSPDGFNHIEAHISGSGIERKYGVRGEEIESDTMTWEEIVGNFTRATTQTLLRYREEHDQEPVLIGYTGALIANRLDLLRRLQERLVKGPEGLRTRVVQAAYGEDSGLYGARFAAERVLQAA